MTASALSSSARAANSAPTAAIVAASADVDTVRAVCAVTSCPTSAPVT